VTADPAWENPLMPSATLRQIYSAMLRLRMLSEHAGRSHSNRKAAASLLGLEACLVSPVVDLGPEDLVCDPLEIRSVDVLRVDSRNGGRRVSVPAAHTVFATQVPAVDSGPERLWAAAGAAATLRARALRSGTREGAVMICYVKPSDASPAVWARVLAHVSANRLPLLLVVLPQSKLQQSRDAKMSRLAVRHRIPGMPVDQHDAVALYRVAQEAIGHARLGGGGALIECVRYSIAGQKQTAPNPVADLGQYMLSRGAADRRWLSAQDKLLSRQVLRRTDS
jgi:TPP-dependent pyruvate/acetoin dehydrogenase alpha subunit